MKPIQIIYIAILSFFAGNILISCSEENESISGEGKAKIIIDLNTDTSVLTRSGEVDTESILLKVKRIQGEDQSETTYPLSGLTFEKELEAGTYQLTAIVGKDPEGAPTENPYYIGGEVVTLESGDIKTKDITCKLTTAVIQVDYSGIKGFYNDFEYKTVVSTEGYNPITFNKDDEGKSGYFVPDSLAVVFSYNNNGWIELPMDSIPALKPQYQYTIQYTMKDTGEGESKGSVGIGITIDENPEDEKGTIIIPLPKLEQFILPFEEDDIQDTSATIRVYAKLNNGSLIDKVSLKYAKLVSDEVSGTINSIDANKEDENIYSVNVEGLSYFQDYKVWIEDDETQAKTFMTKPLQMTFNYSADAWAKFATISVGADVGIDFSEFSWIYKKENEEIWNVADGTISADEYKTLIKDLDDNCRYEYRLVSNIGDKEGNIVSFTTESASPLPYADFDNWHTRTTAGLVLSKSTAYNGLSGEDIFWDSSNQGTNYGTLGFSSANPTNQETSKVIKGSAARLKSTTASSVFAAASLYTGNFKTVSLSPTGATLGFGQPYTDRPTKLKGYYCYQPVNVTHSALDDVPIGVQDTCNIYIALTTWDEQFVVSTAEQIFIDFDAEDIIAYGAITKEESAKSMTEYAEFEIDLVYRDLTKQPTYIVVVAAASKYGDYFTGGNGSTLYLDEFELVYDYNEASFVNFIGE